MNPARFLTILLCMFTASLGIAKGAVTVSPMTGATVQFVNGKYRVTINRTELYSVEPYFIRGNANDNIEYIRVTLTNDQTENAEIKLFIEDAPGSDGIGRVAPIIELAFPVPPIAALSNRCDGRSCAECTDHAKP